MLNLEVCRKCWKLRGVSWNIDAEAHIKDRGFVYCNYFPIKVKLQEDPPDTCSHKFEHAIAAALESTKCSNA